MSRTSNLIRLVPVMLAFLVVGCQSPGLIDTGDDDLEVQGWESGTWHKDPGDPSAAGKPGNFTFFYETVGWKGDEEEPYHRMKTEVRLTYDRERGGVSDAMITSSGDGRAYRHVCFTPTRQGLRLRVVTHLDDRGSDLTVVRLDGPAPSIRHSGGYGVGPWEGLNEAFDVVFRKDGSFRLTRASAAHLADADVRLERTMSTRENASAPSTAKFPQE